MPTRRKSRLALAARGQSPADGSDNFKACYVCEAGDRPSAIVVSLRGLDLVAAKAAGIGRLIAYKRKNVEQDLPNVLPVLAAGTAGNLTDAQTDSELIVDIDIGVSQGPSVPAIIPIDGVTMQDGESFVVEGSNLLDNANAAQVAVWSIVVMGACRAQARAQTA